jgi:hypothetical protein
MTTRSTFSFLPAFLLLTHFALAAPPLATTPLGLESRVFYRSQDSGLLPTPVGDKADVTLRIASRAPDSASSAWTIYDLRAIAAAPGDFDLRNYLRHADNSPVTDGEPILIRATSSLAPTQNGDLFPIATGAQTKFGGYRLALIILGALWLTPLAWLIAKRFRRRKELAAQPTSGPPTLADQIRPLVESAMTGTLADPEQARLERLLIAHWRERLQLSKRSHADTISILRLHQEAGPLLTHLETWLHKPASTTNGNHSDLRALLAPYKNARPIEEVPA